MNIKFDYYNCTVDEAIRDNIDHIKGLSHVSLEGDVLVAYVVDGWCIDSEIIVRDICELYDVKLLIE